MVLLVPDPSVHSTPPWRDLWLCLSSALYPALYTTPKPGFPPPGGGLGKFAQGIYQAQDTSSGRVLLLEPPDPREAVEAQGHTLYHFTQDFSQAAAALPLPSPPPIIPLLSHFSRVQLCATP